VRVDWANSYRWGFMKLLNFGRNWSESRDARISWQIRYFKGTQYNKFQMYVLCNSLLVAQRSYTSYKIVITNSYKLVIVWKNGFEIEIE
jgi:hypothetical protein